jgi:hypothetical protein
MKTFIEQRLSTGVGVEHINRFRIYFHAKQGMTVKSLAADLQNNFAKYFSTNNKAMVRMATKYPHGKFKTMQFRLHTPVMPEVHEDWVAIEWESKDHQNQLGRVDAAGFAVQTLKRDFPDPEGLDDLAMEWTAATLAGGGLYAPPVAKPVVLVSIPLAVSLVSGINRCHFLAGRRSWMICDAHDDPDHSSSELTQRPRKGELFFLESAAIERFSSHWFAAPMDEIPVVSWYASTLFAGADIPTTVRRLWTQMLKNFVAMKGLRWAEPPPGSRPSYDTWNHQGGGVYAWMQSLAPAPKSPYQNYVYALVHVESPDQAALRERNARERQSVRKIHPFIGE